MARKNYYVRTPSRLKRTAWTKRLVAAAAVIVAAAVLWKLVIGEMGVVKYYRMSAHARSLRSEIEHLRTDNARLAKEVAALRSDLAYIERLARDKIGLARPGEVVYYYGDPAN
jgi:cell division protein FtsB